MIYGAHLMVIAALNALLWLLALRGRGGDWDALGAAIFPVVIFAVGTVVAFIAPPIAPYVWFLAFAAPLIGWFVGRQVGRTPG